MPNGSFRWLLNMGVDVDGQRARRAGWDRLSGPTPVNQDLHDQRDRVYNAPETFTREPITMLHAGVSQSLERRLYAATKSRYYMQEGSGWTTIARNMTGSGSLGVPHAAQLGDNIVFTNGVNKPVLHKFGTVSVAEIPHLTDAPIRLTRATLAVSYNGCIFLMDTFENNIRYPSRVRWSGFNAPGVWKSSTATVVDTLAGFQDLPYDEAITCAAELANTLYIFTNRSMYKCLFNGVSFSFERVYSEPRAQATLPAFPNSLVSDGSSLWWVADDGVYQYNIYMASGTRVQWLHGASKRMMDAMDRSCCQSLTAGYNPVSREIWWSYPTADRGCLNSECMVANVDANSVDYVDHGFTSFVNAMPDNRQTLREWMAQWCTNNGSLFAADGTCAFGASVVEDFCETCNTSKQLVAASADDFCLKNLSPTEAGPVYFRLHCTNLDRPSAAVPTVPTSAELQQRGYLSIMRGTFPFGNLEGEKSVRRLLLEAKSTSAMGDPVSGPPLASVMLRIGTSYSALDANPRGNFNAIEMATLPLANPLPPLLHRPDACEVIWRTAGIKRLGCAEGSVTSGQHLATNTRPDLGFDWPLMEVGRFLHYEVSVIGKPLTPGPPLFLATGGNVSFSRIEVQALLKPRQG